MTIGFLFWFLMILWLCFSIYFGRTDMRSGNYGPLGLSLFVFVLLFLVGWKLFGFPIQG